MRNITMATALVCSTLLSCQCTKQQLPGHEIVKSKRSIGQLLTLLNKYPQYYLTVRGTVSDFVVFVPIGQDSSMSFALLSNVSALNQNGEDADNVNMEDIWINIESEEQICTSGRKIQNGTEIVVFLRQQTKQAKNSGAGEPESLVYYSPWSPLFDKKDNGKIAFKGEHRYYRIIEESEFHSDNLGKMTMNVSLGNMRTYGDMCRDTSCENNCDTRGDAINSENAVACGGTDSCLYGIECAQVRLLDVPDICQECGEQRDEESEIIERDVNGERYCWNGMESVECPE